MKESTLLNNNYNNNNNNDCNNKIINNCEENTQSNRTSNNNNNNNRRKVLTINEESLELQENKNKSKSKRQQHQQRGDYILLKEQGDDEEEEEGEEEEEENEEDSSREKSAFLKSYVVQQQSDLVQQSHRQRLNTTTSSSQQQAPEQRPTALEQLSDDSGGGGEQLVDMNSQKRKRSAGAIGGLSGLVGGSHSRSHHPQGYVLIFSFGNTTMVTRLLYLFVLKIWHCVYFGAVLFAQALLAISSKSSGIGKASFIHALVVIFLEFFAWGLLTDQVITVLNDTFPNSTFLANGLIHGLKGLLSFLSAPLIGAMSDIWGRKVFLLITVFFTCLPIPLMRINPMWYFAMISISGLFAVTFSVVFAYVADVTDESNRTTAYGLVSATFAASLITSPALGSYLSRFYSENFVVALATAIAIFDLFFILVAVPESLPEKIRERSKGISWDKVDPFKSLRVIFKDRTITLLCITVFLSYLPEAGQYSCFFVYLKLIVGFSQQQVAYFIAYVGILSCISQAAILVILIRYFGSRQSIIIGLAFQVVQLALYGFAAQAWLIWFSGMLAAISSIGYPAISAYISNHSHVDQQGVSQGMVTGIRGLCNGIGPALYGFVFWIFRVNLNEDNSAGGASGSGSHDIHSGDTKSTYASTHLLPGPPFLFGSVLALMAIFVTWLIPPSTKNKAPILLANSTTLSSKYHKDNTLVKIGNTSSTYNRTSSSSSIALPSDIKLQGSSANTKGLNQYHHHQYDSDVKYSNQDEIEHLLLDQSSHHHNHHYDSDSLSTSSYHHHQIAQMGGANDIAASSGVGGDVASGGGVINAAFSSSQLALDSLQQSHYPNNQIINEYKNQLSNSSKVLDPISNTPPVASASSSATSNLPSSISGGGQPSATSSKYFHYHHQNNSKLNLD